MNQSSKDNHFIKQIFKDLKEQRPSKLVKRDTWLTKSAEREIITKIVNYTTGKK